MGALLDTLSTWKENRPWASRIACLLMSLSLLSGVSYAVYVAVTTGNGLLTPMTGNVYNVGYFSLAYFTLLEVSLVGMGMLVYYDIKLELDRARYTARLIVVSIVFTVLASLAVNGVVGEQILFIFQFGCVVSYQVINDPNLEANAPWYNPFSRKAKERAAAEGLFNVEQYMPANFFNVFWVFIVGSVVGLGIETWYRWFTAGIIEDRAGLLYGPFSPIYGIGAVLMTFALNRFWNKPAWLVFVVSGAIGAGFEWLTSWYMEASFGISAWDYSEAIGSIGGRTDLAHAIAWGAIGFIWIRYILPIVMRCVDAIAFKWRAAVTIVVFSLMLTNAGLTLLALESWGQRSEGYEPQGDVQVFFAEHYDDDMMEARFETMLFKKDVIAAKVAEEEGQLAGDGFAD